MLILTRRRGQRIMVGSEIEIVVVELSRGTVKLGIRAPGDMAVLRAEVWENIAQANQEAAQSTLADKLVPPKGHSVDEIQRLAGLVRVPVDEAVE
jgi:carbon storage regulator